jgi:hypothetical protein
MLIDHGGQWKNVFFSTEGHEIDINLLWIIYHQWWVFHKLSIITCHNFITELNFNYGKEQKVQLQNYKCKMTEGKK